MGKPDARVQPQQVTQPLDPDELFAYVTASAADNATDSATQQIDLDPIDAMPLAVWQPEGTGVTRVGVGSFRRHVPQIALGVVAIAGALAAYSLF